MFRLYGRRGVAIAEVRDQNSEAKLIALVACAKGILKTKAGSDFHRCNLTSAIASSALLPPAPCRETGGGRTQNRRPRALRRMSTKRGRRSVRDRWRRCCTW